MRLLQERIRPDEWLQIRYEELVKDPQSVLRHVCGFLGVEYSDEMLSYPVDTTYALPDARNADRWRERLSPREVYLAEMAAGDVLEDVGYDLLNSGRLRR